MLLEQNVDIRVDPSVARPRQAGDDRHGTLRRRQHDPRRQEPAGTAGRQPREGRSPPADGVAAWARPPGHSLEVADVFHAHGAAWRKANAGHTRPRPAEGHVGDRDLPHRRASAATSSAARTARTSASPTVPAATATAPSARPPRRGNGSRRPAKPNSCRFLIFTRRLHPTGRDRRSSPFQNKAAVYDPLLFRTAAETLTVLAADPKHLGARIGLTAVLHTWGSAPPTIPTSTSSRPAAAWPSPDAARWTSPVSPASSLPVRVLSRLFHAGSFSKASPRSTRAGRLAFLRRPRPAHREKRLRRRARAVAPLRVGRSYAKRPFAGPGSGARLSRALHPPRRHLQLQAHRARRQGRHLQNGKTTGSRRPRPAQDYDARTPPSSSAAFSCTSCRAASTASAITASIAGAVRGRTTSSAFANCSPPPRSRAESERAEADNETETPPTARRCPCCGGRMIIIDTFEGARPAQSPSPTRIRIDTS